MSKKKKSTTGAMVGRQLGWVEEAGTTEKGLEEDTYTVMRTESTIAN